LSHFPENNHPNDSNIFARNFRIISENFSGAGFSASRAEDAAFHAQRAGFHALKFSRGMSENFSQKYLSRLSGIFQTNDSNLATRRVISQARSGWLDAPIFRRARKFEIGVAAARLHHFKNFLWRLYAVTAFSRLSNANVEAMNSKPRTAFAVRDRIR
jgi:hypothetical protein